MNKVQRWTREKRTFLIVSGLIFTFILLFELPKMVVVVGPGEVAVKYSLFFGGTVIDHVYPEGLKLIFPWDKMYVYNTRIQESKLLISVLTQDGLEVEIGLSVRYHPEVATIGILHQAVGPDYATKIAIPEVESAIRSSAGKHSLQELYSGLSAAVAIANVPNNATGAPAQNTASAPNETALADDALDTAIAAAVDRASRKYVLIDNVVITRIRIPDYIQAAMQRKIEQQQLAEAQAYRLDQAQQEVKINEQLDKSLTANVLRLKGIEATEKIAASPNSKVVIIGNDSTKGLPIVVGTQ